MNNTCETCEFWHAVKKPPDGHVCAFIMADIVFNVFHDTPKSAWPDPLRKAEDSCEQHKAKEAQ